MVDEFIRNGFTISTDPKRLDLAMIHGFLTTSYWSPGITRESVEQFIPHSFCFGLYQAQQQIGFARIISDYVTFAYLADVFVLDEFQERGLGTWLVQTIVEHPKLQNLRRWVLFTRDAHSLYSRFGFAPLVDTKSCMQIHASNPKVDQAEKKN